MRLASAKPPLSQETRQGGGLNTFIQNRNIEVDQLETDCSIDTAHVWKPRQSGIHQDKGIYQPNTHSGLYKPHMHGQGIGDVGWPDGDVGSHQIAESKPKNTVVSQSATCDAEISVVTTSMTIGKALFMDTNLYVSTSACRTCSLFQETLRNLQLGGAGSRAGVLEWVWCGSG